MAERTEFVKLMVDRFADTVYPDNGDAVSDEIEDDYLFIINAPGQYENGDETLAFAKEHPESSVKDLIHYFTQITPPGLPPCAVDWDDDDDNENE